MEDVIKRSGGTFGTNEVIILSQLSLAAIPTSCIIFLDLVTDRAPGVCTYNADHSECLIVMTEDPVSVCNMSRANWTYLNTEVSIISNFDMLCWPKYYLILIDLLFYLGMLTGCAFAGLISDWLGRKPTLMLFLFAETLFTGLLILSTNYTTWAILRFFTGIGIGHFVVCKVLIIESLKIHYRHVFLGVIWSFFAVGLLLLALMDLWFRRYIDIIACITVYLTFLWLMYLFGIEESLRWLLVKRKKEEATYLLTKIEFRNKVTLPKYEDIPKPRDDEFTFIDIFTLSKSKYLITTLLAISIVSFYLLVQYTTTETTDVASNIAINLAIVGCLHLLGVLLSSTSSHFLGRKPTATCQILTTFILMIVCIVFMGDLEVVLMCAMAIRCIAAGLVYFCSLYSLEVFASPFRAKAVGLVLSGAAVGGIISALTHFITKYYMLEVEKYIVQSVVVLIVTILSLSLRETKGRPLPERIEQMPQVLPVNEWMSCSNNEEEHPLLDTPAPTPVYNINPRHMPGSSILNHPNIDRGITPGTSEFRSTPGRHTRFFSI